jgi:hypothetical protein
VVPVQDKACDIEQYFKENRGLRTGTTINNTYDFFLPLPDIET